MRQFFYIELKILLTYIIYDDIFYITTDYK